MSDPKFKTTTQHSQYALKTFYELLHKHVPIETHSQLDTLFREWAATLEKEEVKMIGLNGFLSSTGLVHPTKMTKETPRPVVQEVPPVGHGITKTLRSPLAEPSKTAVQDPESRWAETSLNYHVKKFADVDFHGTDIYPYLELIQSPTGKLLLIMGTLTETYPKDGPREDLRGCKIDINGQVDFVIAGRNNPHIARAANGSVLFNIGIGRRNVRALWVEEGMCIRMWVQQVDTRTDMEDMHIYAVVKDCTLKPITKAEYQRARFQSKASNCS